MKKIKLLTGATVATSLFSIASITSCGSTPTVTTYTVTFDKNCKDETIQSLTQKVVSGDTVIEARMLREDYVIKNWCTDNKGKNPFDFSTKITQDTTLYADWVSAGSLLHKVTFNMNDGSEKPKTFTQKVLDGETVVSAHMERSGYTFIGWFTESACENLFNFNNPITADTEIFAKWEIIEQPVTVTFISEGKEIGSQTIEKGSTVVEPKNPTKEHSTFDGWFTESTYEHIFDFKTKIDADMTLYAKWTPIASKIVTFDTGNGSSVDSQTVYVGETAKIPTAPKKNYAEFVCWCEDNKFENPFDFNTPITDNKTLYAKWNTHPTSIEVYDRTKATELTNLTLYVGDVVNPFKVKSIWTDGTNTETLSEDLQDYTITGGTSIVSYDDNHYITAAAVGTDIITLTPNDTKGGAKPALINVTVSNAYEKYLSFSETTIQGVEGYAVSANTASNAVVPSSVVIPSTFNSKPVIAIANNGFENQTAIQVVSLPYTILSIGDSAFSGANNLERINLPEGLLTIGKLAFSAGNGTGKLARVTLPSTVTSIGHSAFASQKSLKSIVIPKSVTTLGQSWVGGVFQYCESLESVTFEEGTNITILYEYLFKDCKSLTSISIPEKITTIKPYVFQNCNSLARLELPTTLDAFGAVEGSPLANCPNLKEFYIPKASQKFYTYNSSTHEWGDNGDTLCQTLTTDQYSIWFMPQGKESIVVPAQVKTINKSACERHSSLETISFETGSLLETIDDSAFAGCSKLSIVDLSNCTNLIKIADNAFGTKTDPTKESCSSLNQFTWPTTSSGLTLGKSAFCNATSLTTITIPSYVTYIDQNAFEGIKIEYMLFGTNTTTWKWGETTWTTQSDDNEKSGSTAGANATRYKQNTNAYWERQ